MSSLTYITTCQLCPQQFNHGKLAELIAKSPLQAIRVFDALKEHFTKKHKHEDGAAQVAAQAFLGLLRVQHFASQDDSAIALRDFQRWQIFQMVKKAHVPDTKIIEQVRALQLPAEFEPRVFECIKIMRDILEELGRFQPANPQEESVNPAAKNPEPSALIV